MPLSSTLKKTPFSSSLQGEKSPATFKKPRKTSPLKKEVGMDAFIENAKKNTLPQLVATEGFRLSGRQDLNLRPSEPHSYFGSFPYKIL
jgi:hypothetical protein